MEKSCFKCGRRLPITEFYRHPMMGNGHLGKCKECTKRDVRSRYYSKYSEIREYERRRLDDPARRAKQRSYQRSAYASDPQRFLDYKQKSDARYPEKRKARIALGNAIRDGRIKREPCIRCGNPKAHGHHEDYGKPLEVMWLCSKHHGEQHRKQREAA